MSDINIPAVASGAFLGFLAILVAVTCIPPMTRFLGDLCCCPWRIPFTKKKRRNGDEDLEKDDLPYVVGDESPRAGTAVDDQGYQRVSAAYMSAVSVVDPTIAQEGMQQNTDYRTREHSPQSDYRQSYGAYSNYQNSNNNSQHLQIPHQGTGWRQPSPEPNNNHLSSPERYDNHPPPPPPPPPPANKYYNEEGYSPDYYPSDPYAESYIDIQRPPPSHIHTPPEVNKHSYSHGYFQTPEGDQEHYARHYRSTERLMGPRPQYPKM